MILRHTDNLRLYHRPNGEPNIEDRCYGKVQNLLLDLSNLHRSLPKTQAGVRAPTRARRRPSCSYGARNRRSRSGGDPLGKWISALLVLDLPTTEATVYRTSQRISARQQLERLSTTSKTPRELEIAFVTTRTSRNSRRLGTRRRPGPGGLRLK